MQEQLRPQEAQRAPFPLEIPGIVRISHLASTAEGFTLHTRETLRIKEDLTKEERQPEDFAKGTPIRERATKEMRQEMIRALKHAVQLSDADEQLLLKTDHTSDELAYIHTKFAQQLTSDQHQQYIDMLLTTRKTGLRSARKVGIMNIQVEENTVTFDVKNPYYRMYAAIPPTASAETRELDHPAAVAMVVQTADNKLVLQYRKPFEKNEETGVTSGNRFYGGIPGVSAAGYFDAPRGPHGTGKPGEIDNNEVVKMATREAREELGLVPQELTHVAITGIAQDLLKPHDELLLFTKTAKTASEMRHLHISEETANSDYDFAETFYTIPATPDAVEKLLTQVRVPLPPTHVAAFFAAGNALALEQLGPEKAKAWSERVAKGIQDNFSSINSLVAAYWQQRTADVAVIQDPQEKARQEQLLSAQTKDITITAYDPSLSAAQQGLPELTQELERTELLERSPSHAWLFDIDGVITNPLEKRITQPEIVEQLIHKLQEGQPVALITGRALPWVEERVVSELTKYIHDHNLSPALLDNMYVAGEFGGSTITFHNGEAHHHIDADIAVPLEVIAEAKAITEKYSTIVFTDLDKQTQYTSELQPGVSVEQFHNGPREEIANAYKAMLQRLQGEGVDVSKLEVHEDRIAINIRRIDANKRYATNQFLEWLAGKNISPQQYFAFGDSAADLEMGIELHTQQKPFTFVYTGDIAKDMAGRQLNFPIRGAGFTPDPNHTDMATLAILKDLDLPQED